MIASCSLLLFASFAAGADKLVELVRPSSLMQVFDVPMSLDFRIFDTTVMILSVFITHTALQDGCSNWLEGSILIAIYILIAIICWYIPDSDGAAV